MIAVEVGDSHAIFKFDTSVVTVSILGEAPMEFPFKGKQGFISVCKKDIMGRLFAKCKDLPESTKMVFQQKYEEWAEFPDNVFDR